MLDDTRREVNDRIIGKILQKRPPLQHVHQLHGQRKHHFISRHRFTVCFRQDINLSLQPCNQIGKSKEEILEHALKLMSLQAFDALLDCGVRDLTGLLRLTTKDLRQVGTSPLIITELMGIQFQISEHTTKSSRRNNETVPNETNDLSIPEEQRETYEETGSCIPVLQTGTPIPNDLIERLSKRAQNFLIRKNILTCERLLEFHKKDLFCIYGIGRKTVFDIRGLQAKVIHRHPELSRSSSKTAHFENQARVRLQNNSRHPSDPADWSLLSHTLPEIFRVTLPICNVSNDDEQRTISDIGIPEADILRLKGIVLFPEDPIEFLFSITTGYLVRASISDEAFTIISDHFSCIADLMDQSDKVLSTASVSDIAIYADIQTNLL